MGKSVSKQPQEPLQPKDFFTQFDTVPDTFGNVHTKETIRQLPSFNPNEYSYLNNPTPYDDIDVLTGVNSSKQGYTEQISNSLKQFGVNFASGFGQGLINLADVTSWGNDTHQSSLFGLSTKDMQDWATGVSQRNKIEREDPGSFNPGSFGWWMEQVGSSGTGLGMGAFSLLETAAIEAATGGAGTGAAINRLGSLFKRIKDAEGAEGLITAANAIKDMRSAATTYGVLSRLNESRMEAMQSYTDIADSMSKEKNPDGTARYSSDEINKFAAAGANRTFLGNIALMPLDILAYRTMVFNPISGSSEGFIEKAISNIGNKVARKTTQYLTGAASEGLEEGFQYVASEEGKHYAKVLGGTDDSTSFLQRLGSDVTQDEFWNNFAGGVIGSPIIGGAMNAVNKVMSGNRAAKLNSIHDDYIKNIAKMDNAIANKIKQYQEQGDTEKANILRRQFRANKAIAALHLDAMTDRDSAFNSHLNFLQGTLDEINQGKIDSLQDLGFENPTEEQIAYIKNNFQDSINDANQLKGIYDNVKTKYDRNFVPGITQDYFQLNKLLEAVPKVDTKIAELQGKLSQFGELTPYGREQYNAEYQLQGLMIEQSRLTNEYKSTSDKFEKENIDKLLELNKSKITKLKNRLDEIGKEDNYTDEQRWKDSSIIDSALKDKDYAQAIYDKEHLENAITLQRKNISLWNNKEYTTAKIKESIAKAKTVQQVENTEEDLTNKNEITSEIQESINDKKNEINSQEAAAVVQKQVETNTDPNEIGNSSLFEEDNQLINDIKNQAIGKSKAVDNEDQNTNAAPEEVFLLAPSEFDFNNSPQEAKDKVINGVRGLVDRLQGEPDFEKLVRHTVKVQGIDTADSIFNALKWGWEQAGFKAEDYQAVYNKIFGDPFDDLLAGTKGLTIKTTTQLEEATNKVTEEVVARQQEPEGFDNNNQPIYVYKGVVTNEASPKMAFNTRLSQLIQSTDDEGNIVVSHEYTEDELNAGDYVDSLQLLDPDRFNEGTELIIKVPDNFNEIKIPVYNSDGTKGRSVTFGQYVANKGLTPDMQEYQDKIPMIIYKNPNEKGVAFVHDIGWYHPLRFHQEYQQSMDDAINHTRKIRKTVLDNNKKADIVITGKRQTTFAGLKTKKDETITLQEANPETQLTVALTTDSLSTSKSNRVYPNDNTVLVNNSPFNIGQVFDVRRYGTKEGKKSFIALPIIKPKLDETSRASVLHAINIYTNRSNQNQEIRSKHDPIVKYIQDTMGLDILSAQGLEKYLHHFISTFNTEKASTNEHVEQQAKAKLAPGTPYIAFIAGGNIVIGKAGEAAYVDKSGNKKYSFFINPNVSNPSALAITNLAKPGMITWYEQNVNLDNLNRNKPVVTINKDLQVSVAANSYNEFLLSKLRTNIRSYNIGTQEKPNYVTNVQPIITYDLKETLQETQPTNEEVRSSIIPTESTTNDSFRENVESENTEPNTATITELERQILEQAKKDLGADFGISKNKNLFAPAELTETQRQSITKSINRIAGLTPDQQFDIVDFMYNQVTAMVNLENIQVTKAEVDKQVEQAFNEVIQPLKKSYQDKVKELEGTLRDHPALQSTSIPDVIEDYKYRISKIEAVEKSFSVLKEEAYNRVAKYTGITQNKIVTEQKNDDQPTEENPDIDVEDETNGKERDFWTDILQENPESRLSYSMRRFFGQIREYDKSGNPMTGFLGLPTYTGSDTVIRTLMVTLADVPSSFDAMLAKLGERKQGITWMQEVIDKLKGATNQQKQQFVTVMSNTSLRMKFTMISFNRRTNSWTTKVWDTHMNGVADAVKREWVNNFKDSTLVLADDEGDYKLNDIKAKSLIATFEGWIGKSLQDIPYDMSGFRPIVDQVKLNKPNTFTPQGELLQWLKTNLVRKSDRVKFSMKGSDFQVINLGDNKFQIGYLQQNVANKEEVDKWLQEFGITLSEKTLSELMEKGLFHNYQQRKPNELFDGSSNTNGLFGILYNNLRTLVDKSEVNFTEEGNSPLDNSVINSLANLEAKYNTTNTPFGFRDNGKSFFALTAPKFVTDRVRDLKSSDETVRQQLKSISFNQSSLWLYLLNNDVRFRDKFGISHIGANAFKELGKKLYRDNGITKLSDVDHELTKLGMFWDTTQGEVRYGADNFSTYPTTNVEMRMATMFSPTMSDKHMMTLITTAVLNLGNADLNNGAGISEDVSKVLYEQLVRPELKRMIKFWQNGGKTNISAYDKGASMFLLLPELNNIEYAPGLKLVDAIKHQSGNFTIDFIDGNEDLRKSFNHSIKEYVDALVTEKLEVWKNNGILTHNEKGEVSDLKFFDKKYKDKFRGSNSEIAKMAAMDFVINSMVANANSFMTMAGDPALYYKSKAADPITKSKDTFVNVGKRLANQIAPGTTLSNSEHEKYIQIFIQDRVSKSENIAYLEKLLGKEEADSYRKIEGSDAQEYTTWKEHLDILSKMGKLPDTLTDITQEEIQEAAELFSSDITAAKLTEKQRMLISKVMQPIKPVYTGQIYDAGQDVMRVIYIKSSSFPLIPQLTAGMEIDKLRVSMEKLQSSNKMNVRASYQTANKVGSVNNPTSIWTEEGKIDEEALKNISQSTLVLDRKNFRIQQEVPFKSGKIGEDKITLGTQLMKLLFGDEIMNLDGFTYNGGSYSGKDLHRIYNQSFITLVREKRNQLYSELGLNEEGLPIDTKKSMQKLQSLLKEEAVNRGYPLQDIEGLTLTKDGQFNLPLWASSNSNRYESMLNAIVTNRLIRMKFPGNSFVVGSEEGFRVQDNLNGINKSKIIWTSAWNKSHLQASYTEGGQLKKAQVLIASKFKNAKGELVDLFTKKDGEYVYLNRTDDLFLLKEGMFDKELLSMVSFRIPTSGLQSASQIEVVGFLPAESADLMIVPRNFTKQKGLDFDVDKENTYMLWNYMNDDGSFEIMQEKHRSQILAKADSILQEKNKSSIENLFNSIFGDISQAELEEYTDEEIAADKKLAKLNSKITEKLLQNDIIKINHAVLGNPDPKVQAKISKTLNTDYAEAQADFIEKLTSGTDNKYWTPLSDEYQKQKMMMGASGKIGTGAYSLDVVFHSLAQQAAINNRAIQLIEVVDEGEETIARPKVWRFGTIESTGILGGTTTLDGNRTISEVMAERQNVAVDNEKLQIMGRVNLNDITMDVDKVMNMLGFDRGKDGNSISFLFLSQPIIKEFVSRMKNANSNVAEFEVDKEGKIFDELIAKYEEGLQTEVNEDYWNVMSDLMTNDNFITAIQAEKPDGKLQGAVLRRFMEMRKYGIAIRGIQVTINTDSKGLGKSFFDVIEKRNALNRLGIDTNMIIGASGLIGDYLPREGELQEGYIDIGDFYVKPDTLSGAFNILGVTTAYNLWNKYFPYDAKITNKGFEETLSIIGSENMGDSKIIELKQEVFRGMKKYFAASKLVGIISPEDNINDERRRLFIDSEENTSLAKYLKTIIGMVGDPVVDTFIKTNKLINRFEYDIQKNGKPSLIKYNNASGEEFDEQYLYESLATLMELRGKTGSLQLPEVGNKKYTLDTLAQDLIAYCYLGNAIQEAIQFTKYVPISYLNQIGFSEKMRITNSWLDENPNILGIKIGNKKTERHLVSEFTMQFVQHNPERVKYKLDSKTFSKAINKIDDNSFTLKGEDKPIFISVYDSNVPKGEKKFRLYWFDGEKYTKIPVLGTFGMDEYQVRSQVGQSIVNGKVKIKVSPQPDLNKNLNSDDTTTNLFSLNTGDGYQIVKAIADSNSTRYTDIAKHLLPFAENTKVVIGDEMELNGRLVNSFNGFYNPETGVITIHSNIVNDPNKLADTIIHELVHKLTYNAVNPHIKTNPETGLVELINNPSTEVQDLVRLYNNLRMNVNNDTIKEIIEKVGSKGLTVDEKGNFYGYTNIHEFMAMALTSKEFQKVLASIEYKQTGKSILSKFKEIIGRILQSVGIQFDDKFTLAHAVNSIFDIIEKSNLKVDENPFEVMNDEVMNYEDDVDWDRLNNDFLDRLDNNNNNDENPEVVFSPRDLVNLDTDNKSNAQIHFFSPDDNVGVFVKFIQFKTSQLREYNRRLRNIEVEKRRKGISPAKLRELSNLERELKLLTEGNFELGITGLRQQIEELGAGVNPVALGYYVNKDLNRLKQLSVSPNTDDLHEAQRLIDFYDLAGTFTRGVENPFFHQSEMFLEDENGDLTTEYRLTQEVMDQFKEWRNQAISYQSILNKRKEEVTVQMINSNPSVKNTYGNNMQFSFNSVIKDETGLKDTDWVSMWTMDITQGIFSHNGIIPQVMFSYLSNSFEKRLAWTRQIEEKVDKISPDVQKELIKMGHSLRGGGILGLKGASYQLFKEITKEGNETGGIVQRFIKEFFDQQSSVLNKFSNDFDSAKLYTDPQLRAKAFNTAFEELKKWRRNHTIIMDVNKIPELTSSTPETEAYKKSIVDVLGERGYNDQLQKQKRLLDKFESEKQSMIDTLLIMEGKNTFDELSDKAKSDFKYWENNHDPKKGVEDYYSVKGIFFGGRKANNFMDYNTFIPRRYTTNISISGDNYIFSDTNTSTGYYSKAFEDIEANDTLREFYDIIKEVCDTVRENMPYELQQLVPANTMPGLRKSFVEIIADKNIGVLKTLIPAFRHLWEKIRLGFGVIKQNELSYAVLDPITGRTNYKVNDQFMQSNARAIKERLTIEKAKFLQAFNVAPENIKDIRRFSVIDINRFSPAALVMLAQYINSDISIDEINRGDLKKITDITGQNVEIGKYIRDFSIHSIVQSQSFDLAKIGKYFSNMTMLYAARQEALPILEIMKNHYESIKKPKTQNLHKNIFNVPGGQFEMAGLRTNAIRQMDDWFERVALDNYGGKHRGVHGKKVKVNTDSQTKKVETKIPFYAKKIFSDEEKKKIKEVDELLSNTKIDEDMAGKLAAMKADWGKERTATAIFDNLFAWIRTLRLGYNLSSASTNFLEGVTSNMILASQNEYFDPKEIFYGYSVARSSFIKNITFGLASTKAAKKNRKLMDKFNVIMDSKNELQKSSVKTYANKFSWMSPHELNQRVEYVNQSPIMIAMLRALKIKDKNGNESKLWDAFNSDGHLRDEFKTDENVRNWEELIGDDYLNFKQKLHKVIVLGHGNYDDLRGMMIKSGTAGKALMMFKTWIPMQLYWRFATEQDDIQTGTKGYKGRYWSYGKGTGAVHGAAIGTGLFGPLGTIAGGALGYFLGANFGTDSGVGFFKEVLESTKSLVKKMYGMPVNMLSSKQIFDIGTNDFEKFVGNGSFTARDAVNLRANMADISVQLAWLALILITKSMFWDDDDKPGDPERVAHNILVNNLMALSSQGAMYTNPVDAFKSTVQSNGVWQYLQDVGKEIFRVSEYLHGRDIIQSGINRGESGLGNQTTKILMPGLFKDQMFGFGTRAEKVFEESPFHPYFKSEATIDKEQNKRQRAEYKLELEKQLKVEDYEAPEDRDKEIKRMIDEKYPTPYKLRKMGMTREEYEEANKEE